MIISGSARMYPAAKADSSTAMHSFAEVPWLQPYPDALLDEVAPSDDEPDAVVVKRETIELAFLAALQLLPARQRAAMIARDVLDWSAIETASLLETRKQSKSKPMTRMYGTRLRPPAPH